MGYAIIVAQDIGVGRYTLRAEYLCCEQGNNPGACVHVPAGPLFDLESPAHLALGMLMKKFAPKLGKAVPNEKTEQDKINEAWMSGVPRDKNIGKKKKRIRGLV